MTDDTVEGSSPRTFLQPAIAFAALIGHFVDVLTLMIRLLYNTVAYDNPQGRDEAIGAATEDRRA